MGRRIRTIKPELLEDEKAAALSDAAWRLFVSSWLLADDHGRFRAGSRYLAAQVWQDTGRAQLAADALAELATAGRVRVYQVDGDTYAEIPTWGRHQRIDNAGREIIPPPRRDSAHLDGVSPRTSANLREPPRAEGVTPEAAALPPDRTSGSDLRNGARDPRAPVGEPGAPKIQPQPVEPDLFALAQILADEGKDIGKSAMEYGAKGHRLPPKLRAVLVKIRDERAAAGAAGARASPPPQTYADRPPAGSRVAIPPPPGGE